MQNFIQELQAHSQRHFFLFILYIVTFFEAFLVILYDLAKLSFCVILILWLICHVELRIIMQASNNHYKYVIVGAGISAWQAAVILAQFKHSFIILEASGRIGGRICSLTLGEGLKECPDTYEWLQKVKNYPIDCGATWICEDHAFMLNYVKEFGLNLTTQYYEGTHVLAENQTTYHQVPKLGKYYQRYDLQIKNLIKSLEELRLKYQNLLHKRQENNISEAQLKQLNQFYQKYDNTNAYDYILEQVKDEYLAGLIAKEAATLQCCKTTEYSVLSLFDGEEEPLANLKFYIGLQESNIDGFRLTEGMLRVPEHLKKKVQTIFDAQGQGKNIDDLVKLNSPVAHIKNNQNPVEVITENGDVYTCEKVITCLPTATFHRINFDNISESKKILVNNQVYSNMTRMAFVFQSPFWRKTHAGYVSFSHNFSINQIAELTPQKLQYGILAFVFTADGFDQWNKSILAECKSTEQKELKLEWYEINKKKSLRIIADIYLQGDIESPHLKEVGIFHKSLSQFPYIKSTYQSVTATSTQYKINQLKDYKDPYDDQLNVVVLGSDFSDSFGGYMEGAIRIARKKIYELCKQDDPLAEIAKVTNFSAVKKE